MTTRTHLRVTGAALFLTAGLACSAWGQNAQPAASTPRQTAPSMSVDAAPHFVDCHKLSGQDVANPNGEVVATIDDLIVDRGSGRVAYAILNSGSVLGLGGKDIAVPYDALTYDRAKGRYNISLTSEQIERAASFSPEEWSDLEHTTWTEDLESWWDETFPDSDERAEHDPYSDAFVRAKSSKATPTTINGEITRVDRRHKAGTEYACVEVRDADGSTRHLVLGPSWYVMGGAGAPMRGDSIKAEAIPYDTDDGKPSYVALQASIHGERVEFRDKNGDARWRVPTEPTDRTARGDKQRDSESHAAYEGRRWGTGQLMMLSDLVDAPASARDDSGGEVQQVILEERSGQIAFIGFDPNENVLGLADEIILVPWTLVSVDANHEARIDSDKDMLIASQEVPDDLNTLSSQDRLARIYGAFGIDPPTFNDRRHSMDSGMPSSRWSSDGELMRVFRNGTETTIGGRIVEVRHETLFAGEPDAIVVVVDTGDGERRVVVGPSWYMTRQRLEFKTGDSISVVGTKATVNGTELIGARTVTSGDRTVVLWSDDNAVWNDD